MAHQEPSATPQEALAGAPESARREVGLSRRRLLQSALGGVGAGVVGWQAGDARAAVQGNLAVTSWAAQSDPAILAQAFAVRFSNALPNPLGRDATQGVNAFYKPDASGSTRFTIAVGQTRQNLLGLPGKMTTVWGYHNHETAQPSYPGRSFEVDRGRAVRVSWKNNLVGPAGPLPHILPVDQSITIQAPTTGVPMAVHHHGGASAFEFDGGPDQWSTPLRQQVGPGITGANTDPNAKAVRYEYTNEQEASMHWYHDHAQGLTRINVHAGLAGLYVIRDANERLLESLLFAIPKAPYEVALVLQDRCFDATGQLAYSANPQDYPDPDVAANLPANQPTHMPEMFGDVILVNGKAWPNMVVEPRPYRVRLLNGSDSRFYTLSFGAARVVQIGTDLGFLNKGVVRSQVTIAPGERMDLVIDFAPARNQDVVVGNTANVPFPNGAPPVGTTAVVMRFQVKRPLAWWVPSPPAHLLPSRSLRNTAQTAWLPTASQKLAKRPAAPTTRRILLAEGTDQYGRVLPMLGTYDPANAGKNLGTLSFESPATERPKLGTEEIWEFWNASVDAHPIHVHLVQFQVIDRRAFTPPTLQATTMPNGWTGARLVGPVSFTGAAVAAPAHEDGWKDTVVCPPNSVTRVLMCFDRKGKYVYHCHILAHEEHDMMRWFEVV